MQTIWQDLRYGARMLMKQPGFTLIAIVTLALGLKALTYILTNMSICDQIRHVKLREWAEQQGVSYRTALRWFHGGTLHVEAEQMATGTIIVKLEPLLGDQKAALYARLSSWDQKTILDSQIVRLTHFAVDNKLSIAVFWRRTKPSHLRWANRSLKFLPIGGRQPGVDFGPDRRYACQRERLSFQLAVAALPHRLKIVLLGDLPAFDQFGSHGDSLC